MNERSMAGGRLHQEWKISVLISVGKSMLRSCVMLAFLACSVSKTYSSPLENRGRLASGPADAMIWNIPDLKNVITVEGRTIIQRGSPTDPENFEIIGTLMKCRSVDLQSVYHSISEVLLNGTFQLDGGREIYRYLPRIENGTEATLGGGFEVRNYNSSVMRFTIIYRNHQIKNLDKYSSFNTKAYSVATAISFSKSDDRLILVDYINGIVLSLPENPSIIFNGNNIVDL